MKKLTKCHSGDKYTILFCYLQIYFNLKDFQNKIEKKIFFKLKFDNNFVFLQVENFEIFSDILIKIKK